MAFTPDTLAVIVQPIGGEGIRFFSYRTDDPVGAVTGVGYFKGVKSFACDSADLIFVTPATIDDEGYVLTVDVDALGDGTGTFSGSELNLSMFGAKGDWNPVTRKGTDDTAAINTAFAAAASLNVKIRVGKGVYYNKGELNYPSGLRVSGEDRQSSQFYIEVDNTQAGGRVRGQNVIIEDIGHVIYLTTPLGADDGEFGSGWTVGQYFTNGEPIACSNVNFIRCGAYAAPGTPQLPAHGFNGMGRVSGYVVEDGVVEGFGGAAVHMHWGANGPGIGQAIVATYHPNNIRVRNIRVKDTGRVYTISSSFDVTLTGIRGVGVNRLGDIIPGDETNTYSVAEEKSLVGSDIHVSDFMVSGIVNSGSVAAMRVISVGNSRANEDAPGVPTRRLLEYRKVLVENGKLVGADDVTRGIDITGAVGDFKISRVDVSEVARAGIGIRAVDNRGAIAFEEITVSSLTGVDVQRTRGVTFTRTEAVMKNRAGLVGDLIGLKVAGSEFNTTLSAAKLSGATSVSLSSALGAVLNPGDIITVGGNNERVSGPRQIRSTETVIPIEANTQTASNGATVYCDQRSVVKWEGGKIELYDFGASVAGCKWVDITRCDFMDISMVGFTGAPKGGVLAANRFVRGGQVRFATPAYATRNLLLSAGSENVHVSRNEFGVDATMIEKLIQTSSDTGNLRIKDNAYGTVISADHVEIVTQSNARLDASQFNEYSGNYRKDGGNITGSAATWYEILNNAIVRYHGTAAPSRGYHRAGSVWVHTSPTVGQPKGGMCTASGTSGTWVNEANL